MEVPAINLLKQTLHFHIQPSHNELFFNVGTEREKNVPTE